MNWSNALCALGFAIYLYGDSYAHRTLDSISNRPLAKEQMYNTGWGHAADKHYPDYVLYERRGSIQRLRSALRNTATVPQAHPHRDLWARYVNELAARISGAPPKRPTGRLNSNIKAILGMDNSGADYGDSRVALKLDALTTSRFEPCVVSSYLPAPEPMCQEYVRCELGKMPFVRLVAPSCAETWERFSKIWQDIFQTSALQPQLRLARYEATGFANGYYVTPPLVDSGVCQSIVNYCAKKIPPFAPAPPKRTFPSIYRIKFKVDCHEASDGDKLMIADLAQAYAQDDRHPKTILVEGYADPRASENHNAWLGKYRAENVGSLLRDDIRAAHMDPPVIEIRNFGKKYSLGCGHTEACYAEQRVAVVVAAPLDPRFVALPEKLEPLKTPFRCRYRWNDAWCRERQKKRRKRSPGEDRTRRNRALAIAILLI